MDNFSLKLFHMENSWILEICCDSFKVQVLLLTKFLKKNMAVLMQIEFTDFKKLDDFPIEFLSSKNREENTIAQWFVIITISDFLIIVKFLF